MECDDRPQSDVALGRVGPYGGDAAGISATRGRGQTSEIVGLRARALGQWSGPSASRPLPVGDPGDLPAQSASSSSPGLGGIMSVVAIRLTPPHTTPCRSWRRSRGSGIRPATATRPGTCGKPPRRRSAPGAPRACAGSVAGARTTTTRGGPWSQPDSHNVGFQPQGTGSGGFRQPLWGHPLARGMGPPYGVG